MARSTRLARSGVLMPTIFFFVGFSVAWIVIGYFTPGPNPSTALRITGKYKLVSPLLLCSTTPSSNVSPYKDLQSQINGIITVAKNAGDATDVSVYFADFSGHWVSVNETESYAPASLLKVPIMIAYFKENEADPGTLSRLLTYDGTSDANVSEEIKSNNYLKPGTYTVQQLINAMIVDSDNNAADLLFANVDKTFITEVFTDLGLTVLPGGDANADNMTAKQYSYFFRILYNSTYLTPEDSEKALELLTQADFPQGIPATVPAGSQVAQKFGERSVFDNNNQLIERELHDCGIVYLPGKPYILCIMTRGSDFGQLTTLIDQIGTTVYKKVNGS